MTSTIKKEYVVNIDGDVITLGRIANGFPQNRLFQISVSINSSSVPYTQAELIVKQDGTMQINGFRDNAWQTIKTYS